MDQSTKLLGIYVLVSLVVFGACIGTWLAYNNAKKTTPTVTPPAKSQPVAPVKAQGTPRPQPVQPAAQATPMPRWTDYPGSGGLIHYRVEPLKKP